MIIGNPIVVGGGGGGTIKPLSVTQNGTYTPPSGVDGYAPVTVNVSGGGDDPYSINEYIESSGTQYIDTGYVPKTISKFEVIATPSSGQPSYSMFFGARDTSSGTAGNPVLFGMGSSSFQIGWGFNLNNGKSSTEFIGKKIKAVVDKDGYDVLATNSRPAAGATYSGTESLTTRSVYLFSLNAGGSDFGSGTHCKAKLYRFRIYEGGTIVHEYIPWVDDNDVVCLKDTITNTLLYNMGTGNFVYGSDE